MLFFWIRIFALVDKFPFFNKETLRTNNDVVRLQTYNIFFNKAYS